MEKNEFVKEEIKKERNMVVAVYRVGLQYELKRRSEEECLEHLFKVIKA